MADPSKYSLADRRHLDRFILHKGGKTVDQIAAEEGVRPETVRNSIRKVEIAQGYHTQEYLTASLIEVILESSPAAKKALLEGLTATKIREATNDHNERIFIKEPDIDTRMKALGEYRQIAAVAQPRPGNQTKIAVGVGVNVAGQASGSYVGMEERMRDIRQKRKEQPVLAAPVVQAAVLEADSEDDEASEDGAS